MSDQNQEEPRRGTGESRLAPPPSIPGTPPLTTSQEQALRAPPSAPGTARSSTGVRPQERAIPSPAIPQTPRLAAAPPPGVAPTAVPGPPSPTGYGGERKLSAAPAVFPQAGREAPLAGPQPARTGQVGAFGPAPPAPAQPAPGTGYGASAYGSVPAAPATRPSAGVRPATPELPAVSGPNTAAYYPGGYQGPTGPPAPGGMPNPGWGQPPANPPPVPPPNASVQTPPPAAYPSQWGQPYADRPVIAPAHQHEM